jgi:DNA-binding transcriptional regulator YhcF (GntR family)
MDTSLVRSPVYQQLNQRLRSALATEYRSGDQFLTEREVAEKFQVSRATANKSLASLVSEGFLEFRKGLGTFVRRDVIDYDVRSLVSFTEKARAAGKKPSTELFTFGKLKAAEVDTEIAAALELSGDLGASLRRASTLPEADQVAGRGIPVPSVDRNAWLGDRGRQRNHSRRVTHEGRGASLAHNHPNARPGSSVGRLLGQRRAVVVGTNALSQRPV